MRKIQIGRNSLPLVSIIIQLRESCSQSQVSPEIYVLPRMSDFQPQQGEDLHNIHSPEGRISSLLLIQRALFLVFYPILNIKFL
jgi:hypothetical protein